MLLPLISLVAPDDGTGMALVVSVAELPHGNFGFLPISMDPSSAGGHELPEHHHPDVPVGPYPDALSALEAARAYCAQAYPAVHVRPVASTLLVCMRRVGKRVFQFMLQPPGLFDVDPDSPWASFAIPQWLIFANEVKPDAPVGVVSAHEHYRLGSADSETAAALIALDWRPPAPTLACSCVTP